MKFYLHCTATSAGKCFMILDTNAVRPLLARGQQNTLLTSAFSLARPNQKALLCVGEIQEFHTTTDTGNCVKLVLSIQYLSAVRKRALRGKASCAFSAQVTVSLQRSVHTDNKTIFYWGEAGTAIRHFFILGSFYRHAQDEKTVWQTT